MNAPGSNAAHKRSDRHLRVVRALLTFVLYAGASAPRSGESPIVFESPALAARLNMGETMSMRSTLARPERRWTMRPQQIKCVCPACRTTYRVPAKAIGHHARCRACGKTFRVGERVSRPLTEDDILLWLRQAEDQDEAAIERRQAATDELTAGSDAESDACPPPRRRSA
jgi:hypothetical protein